MMPTGPALPHVVINAADPLFCLLPLLEQGVLVRLTEAGHPRVTCRAAAAAVAAPLPEADERAQADRDCPQQANHGRYDGAARTVLVRLAQRRGELQRLLTRRAQERIDPGQQTLIELAGPELRDHVGVENRPHLAVGQHALEPVADFDTDAAIASGPEQQQPVVPALLADHPELEELD